jgi:hypothetical protein
MIEFKVDSEAHEMLIETLNVAALGAAMVALVVTIFCC